MGGGNGRPDGGQAHGLLRFATCGSVDDGKSTLIGRLLFDSKQIFEDQLDHVTETSRRRGDEYVDLALLTDGLRAEREQGITIDVAYRYFATPKRDFIIHDTPGHIQYTRNMVTGASTADLSVILIDARNGVVEQSKRHAYISSLLGVPHTVVCVNKMDLAGYEQEAFERVRDEFAAFAAGLRVGDLTYLPISALEGDNVVDRSARMPWYEGPSLLEHLEAVEVASDRTSCEPRFPVQYVIRPTSAEHPDYRGYAGQVAGGVFRPGDEVVVLPSGKRTRIAAIDSFEGELDEAAAPLSVTLRLADDLDVSRGDLIAAADRQPAVTSGLVADLCWMSDAPLRPGSRYAIKHTTRSARATVERVEHRIDIHTLATEPAEGLELNEIGRVGLKVSSPLAVDPYRANRATGSFILIDEATNDTVAAGMVAA